MKNIANLSKGAAAFYLGSMFCYLYFLFGCHYRIKLCNDPLLNGATGLLMLGGKTKTEMMEPFSFKFERHQLFYFCQLFTLIIVLLLHSEIIEES